MPKDTRERFQTVIIKLKDGREGRFSGRVLVEDVDDGRAAISEITFTLPRDVPPHWKLTDVDGRGLDEAGALLSTPAGLTLWNGRGGSWRGVECCYVAARSAADAVRLLKAAGHDGMTHYELTTYFSRGAWGKPMNGIPRERGVWIQRERSAQVERVQLPEGV